MFELKTRFEEDVSFVQTLSFNGFNEIIRRVISPIPSDLYTRLGIQNLQGKFLVLGLLLSDQNIFTCQITYLLTREEDGEKECLAFRRSLLKQLFSAYRYLAKKNSQNTKRRKASLEDYPREALWTVIVFAFLIHDYSTMYNLYIKAFPDRIEFSPDITVKDMREPAGSRIRHMKKKQKKLIRVFRALKLIRNDDFNLNRIYAAYSDHDRQPEIVLTSECFKIVLPNRNVSE